MSDFYDEMKEVTDELILEFGQHIVMTKKGKSAGGRDPVSGLPTPAEPDITINGEGVKTSYRKSEVDGQSVIFGDCKLVYVGDAPEIGMVTVINGESWRVMQPNAVNPAGITLLYNVQLRRG